MKSVVPKRLKYFSYGTLISVRVLVPFLGCLSAYLLIYGKVPKTMGFDTLSIDTILIKYLIIIIERLI